MLPRRAVLLLLLLTLALVEALMPSRGALSAAAACRRLRSNAAIMGAKKKGGKGGKGKKGGPKKSGFEWASSFNNKPFETQALRELVEAAASGYQAKRGSPFHASLVGSSDVPKAVWNAPIACVIAGEAGDAAGESGDPAASQVVYANVAALEAHGLAATAYDDLIGSSTLLPAEMGGDVKFDSDYSKKLKPVKSDSFTFEGTRWLIEKMAVVDGKVAMQRLGVAYMWEEWELDDGVTCAPGGVRRAPEMSEAELEAAIAAQGAAIRSLKEGDGMGNQDPPVVEAVTQLKRLKGLLEVKQAA